MDTLVAPATCPQCSHTHLSPDSLTPVFSHANGSCSEQERTLKSLIVLLQELARNEDRADSYRINCIRFCYALARPYWSNDIDKLNMSILAAMHQLRLDPETIWGDTHSSAHVSKFGFNCLCGQYFATREARADHLESTQS